MQLCVNFDKFIWERSKSKSSVVDADDLDEFVQKLLGKCGNASVAAVIEVPYVKVSR